MQNFIRDWNRRWDPALMTSKVWPNRPRGIIAMLSGGAVGKLREIKKGDSKKVETSPVEP